MKRKFLIIIEVVCVFLIIYIATSIIVWHLENKQNQKIMSSILSGDIISDNKVMSSYNFEEIMESGEYEFFVSGENSSIEENIEITNNDVPAKVEFTNKDLLDKVVNIDYPYDSLNIKTYVINFSALKEMNIDTIGWVKVMNTYVDYPIVQSKDNSYYLTHNFLKEYNSAGWVYADYKNNFFDLDKNTLIYGHNRRNNSMFGSLDNILKKEWYENPENKYIFFATTNNYYIAEIFSVYKISAEGLSIPLSFEGDNDFYDYIDTIKNRSIYNFDTPISAVDNIITLYTCDDNNDYRILLHAKLIKI